MADGKKQLVVLAAKMHILLFFPSQRSGGSVTATLVFVRRFPADVSKSSFLDIDG